MEKKEWKKKETEWLLWCFHLISFFSFTRDNHKDKVQRNFKMSTDNHDVFVILTYFFSLQEISQKDKYRETWKCLELPTVKLGQPLDIAAQKMGLVHRYMTK